MQERAVLTMLTLSDGLVGIVHSKNEWPQNNPCKLHELLMLSATPVVLVHLDPV